MKKLFLLLLVLLVAGCSPNPTAVATLTEPTGSGYPAGSETANLFVTPGYAPPIMQEVLEPTWTPAPGMGKVTGTLKLNGKPVKGILLFLGNFLKNSEGEEFTAVVEPSVSPNTNTDQQGNFAFLNLPPGRYSLIMDTVAKQYLLFKPGTPEYIAIDLPAGGTIDLGTLDYSELPIPDYNK